MILFKIIIIIIAVVALALIINAVEAYGKISKNKISFKEAMDLAELPVITFYQGENKYNFLLDTGSNHSHICKSSTGKLIGNLLEGEVNVQGVGGGTAITRAINTKFKYKNKTYEITLLIGEHLDDTFKSIKESTGVTIHGIIGNSFLSDNRYVLDFDEFIAYSKI